MTTVFDKTLSGFSFVSTYYGDTLQRIAARSMGDASLWVQLISPNGLIPPYITDDPAQAGDGVLLSGQPILVPAPTAAATTTVVKDVFGTDLKLTNGLFTATTNGDFETVSGASNLTQALKNRVETEQGDLIYHMGYGTILRNIIGTGATPAQELLAASTTKASLLQDPRVSSVKSSTATVTGDAMYVTAEVVPITGQSLKISAST